MGIDILKTVESPQKKITKKTLVWFGIMLPLSCDFQIVYFEH